jgi:hypothetical protein
VYNSKWIKLPGPAELWPDNLKYYVEYGFEVRSGRKDRYRKALELLDINELTLN